MASLMNKHGMLDDGSWRIPSFRLDELRRRVEVLNRRVRKTGGPGLSLDLLREEVVAAQRDDAGAPVTERWSVLRIGGEVPRVGGWSFVARVEHHPGLGNIVTRAPSVPPLTELPGALRDASPVCDHCKAARNRKDTFVLSRDGETRRVGRNCLADFVRDGSPERALRLWSLVASVESLLSEAAEEGFGSGAQRGFGTLAFLACTASAIRERGWVSKAAARDGDKQPTASLASFIAGRAPGGERNREYWRSLQPTEADFEEAGEVVAWIEDLAGREDLNDYLHNLRVAVSLGCVERRHEGIVASGLPAYRREVERAVEARREAARAPSEHVGVVGQRYDLRGLTVRSVKNVGSDFGSSLLVIMEDQAGNDLKCFLRGSPGFEAGDVLGGKATVKAHEVYGGRKQTVLIRCKLEKGLPVQGMLVPKASPPAKVAPAFSDEEIPF